MANGEDSAGVTAPTGFRYLDRILNIIGAIAAVMATIWGIFVKIEVDKQTLRVEDLKAEISRAENLRENRKFDLEMTLKIFEEVKDIYKAEGQSAEILVNRLSAVSALVLVVPDQSVRERLGQAVDTALTIQGNNGGVKAAEQVQAVKASIDEAMFDVASASESAPAAAISTAQIKAVADNGSPANPQWGSLNYNLFWCEDAANPNAALEAATQALALKKLDSQARGEWRIRKLPTNVNQRSGYQVHNNLIRTSSSEETDIGNVLAAVLEKYGSPGFTVQQVNYPSPASISIFFCGGR